ncbi:UDP-N-acetylmuramate--L-alanine ligase [Mobilisporobacter senegalensis]|uniref:UDP-N-acetylmuramate--L-alanine ligase n=1 Tax=Mobilisporobacter senegalensis TaxID=1329262 RepID=A0A3N1Y3P9_9FIRM|nr:UDP-N-acetylmuramate--L-alanine ligase [Mobilisporobacter senegalensis]ROR31907.1 UDP-N-acetylmuramate--L-alanine ligase [Mobilisporobacter senegalensis]
MYKIDFNNPIHIHFIGIGGISMSGFAELLHTKGFTITGSDSKESQITKHLESLGINILYGQRASNITSDIDLVVYTAAIREDNEEYQAALNNNIPTMDRALMVGQVMSNYKNSIAISGTHGKTTTTSMLSHVFLEAELDPTISVGGILKAIDGNIRIGNSDNFITEACEYTNSFLKFNPKISVILNVEADHLDFFKDINDIRNSFKAFAQRLPEDGLLILNSEINDYDFFAKDLDCKVVTYGINNPDSNYSALNIGYDELGHGYYDLSENGKIVDHIHLSLVGLHNISNSLSVIAIARELKIPLEVIKNGLLAFKGTDRRFQYKGIIGGVKIIDDYAHHPTEIEATLKAAEKYPHRELWCVFQPHTYTRTKAFLKEFAKALSLADKIVLADIYAAREPDPGDISSKDLLRELENLGKEVYYFPCFDEIENFLLLNCTNGDLLITMGAGDIVTIGEALLGK